MMNSSTQATSFTKQSPFRKREHRKLRNQAFLLRIGGVSLFLGLENLYKSTLFIYLSINFQIFITLLTIVSLFMQDMRIIFIPIENDFAIDILNIIFIIVFMSQIMLSLSIPGYSCSFFFYLDVVSTLSIIMDISKLTNLLYSSNALTSGVNLSVIIRNSKASRAAARAVRVMKIFRLARIVKLYKSAVKAKELKSKNNQKIREQRLQMMKLQKMKQAEKDIQNNASYRNLQYQGGSKGQFGSAQISMHSNVLTKKLIQGVKMQKMKQLADGNENYQNNSNALIQIQQQQEQSVKANLEEDESENITNFSEEIGNTQSKISKLLSDNTMKKIIVVILLLMFSVPVLDIGNYYDDTSAWDFMANFIAEAIKNPKIPVSKINALIKESIDDSLSSTQTNQQLVMIKTPFNQIITYDTGLLDYLRVNDLMISESSQINLTEIMQLRNYTVSIDQSDSTILQKSVSIILSCKTFNQIDSGFSIAKIFFICVIIIYLLHTFNETISHLITEPIQKMLEDMKNNGKADLTDYSQSGDDADTSRKMSDHSNYQTTNVHLALKKISTHISKIFGTKGKQIIYQKIFQKSSLTQNYLQQSKKVFCIVGLVTIQNYCAISEVLKGQAIILNSEIAEYLHTAVYRYGGSGISNYQGSFLVVFQLPNAQEYLLETDENKNKGSKANKIVEKSKKILNPLGGEIQRGRKKMIGDSFTNHKVGKNAEKENNTYLNIFSDFSIYSMVKTLVKINKEGKFFKYRKDARLAQAFNDNFQIKLNCMLHAGWVQQGFIGSSFKMDYCYFGETVQNLKRMSYFCHNFSNSVIVSETLHGMLTQGVKRSARIFGNFTIPSTEREQALYMIDLNLQNISPPKSILDPHHYKHEQRNSVSLKKQLNMEFLNDSHHTAEYRAEQFITLKKQLREVMRHVISDQFRRKYNSAYEYYISGEFAESKDILDDLISFTKDDVLVNRLNYLVNQAQKNQEEDDNNKQQVDQQEKQYIGF